MEEELSGASLTTKKIPRMKYTSNRKRFMDMEVRVKGEGP